MTSRIVYVLATLATLWALAGGDIQQFWSRQALLALILCVTGIVAVSQNGRLREYQKISPLGLRWAVGLAVLCALPLVAILFLAARHVMNFPEFITASVEAFRGPGLAATLSVSFLLSLGWELCSRAVLQPEWGLSNVAFLDALTVGFGSQHLVPFLVVWGMTFVWGFLSRRFGLLSALVSHVVFALILGLALMAA